MGTTADVETKLRVWLADGTFEPGDKLPSERKLIDLVGAGRTTIRQALAKLTGEGLFRVDPKRGYFVCEEARPKRPDPAIAGRWILDGSTPAYDSPALRLDLIALRSPAGEQIEQPVVRLGRVAVAALIDEDDRVLMLWRYRVASQKFSWELPEGPVEGTEEPAVAAARHVEVLTGWRPLECERLVTCHPMPSAVDAPHEIFVCRDATEVEPPVANEQVGAIEWIPLKETPSLMRRGKISGSATMLGLHFLSAGEQANS
jgi:8-oxo-dGTP pyrophosphatase MutT (NUDIX family)